MQVFIIIFIHSLGRFAAMQVFIIIFIHSLGRFAASQVFIMIFIHNKIPPLVLYFYFIIFNIYNIFFLINKDINILDIFIIFMPQVFIMIFIQFLCRYTSLYNHFYSFFMPLRGSASFL